MIACPKVGISAQQFCKKDEHSKRKRLSVTPCFPIIAD
ncbi:hypothetical protein SFJ1713_0569 [Shigella flexneri SFJ17B]|nr:hypothetical protein SFVA6_2515 [Shigella flexneri VA-6]EGM63022.1 hypothetical protein SFJ1713_0569 [Shigella flexneri SFJ17B]EIQ12454.1 hypothetical protein SFK1770_2643 [Shigella flexneri K-1770]